jgi:hypothetical protein
MHPSSSTALSHQVVLDNTFSPIPGTRVGEVDHAKFNGNAVNQVSLVSRVLDEVPIGVSFSKLVLSDALSASKVRNVGVDVDERTHSIISPFIYHSVPLRVVISVQLPVPKQPHSFRELLLTNPILHPQPDHRKAFRFHVSVFFIDKLLASDDSDDTTLGQPLRKGLH